MEKISGRIFVGGLCRETSEASLMEYFKNFGEIDDCFILIDNTTGFSKGYGFVSFTDSAMADRVLAQQDHYILGRKVDVKPATQRGQEHDMLKKIFVGGLPNGLTISQLKTYFERYGLVEDAVIMHDTKGNPRGFGFVTFDSVASASNALVQRFHVLNYKSVEVKKAESVEVKRAESKENTGYAQATSPFYGYSQATSPFYGYAQPPLSFYGYAQAPLPVYGYSEATLPFYGYSQATMPFYGYSQATLPFYGYPQTGYWVGSNGVAGFRSQAVSTENGDRDRDFDGNGFSGSSRATVASSDDTGLTTVVEAENEIENGED